MKRLSAGYRGFTLIELLTVIAIIALLASIILAALGTARQRSRDSKRVADIKSIQLALSLYYNDNSCYPNSIYATPTNSCNGVAAPALAPTYLQTIPHDPLDNSNYFYAALQPTGGPAGSCLSFHLGATLEQSSNTALNDDADTAAGTACTGSASDKAGTDPLYDVHS